jgi:hypothetical protein
MKKREILWMCGGLGALLGLASPMAPAWGKVSAEEAAKLGAELTPLGAVQAGNADGTIPAWDGGITQPPAGYQKGMHHPDPFADDQPLFRITAQNAAAHADRLTPGQKAMFDRYPDTWFMDVYPTRRSASYPQRIYDAAIRNATTAELAEDGNGVANAMATCPFPIPQNGLEVIWNHFLRYRGLSFYRTIGQATPTASGAYTMVELDEQVYLPYAQPGATIESVNNRLGFFLQVVKAPARLAGSILLVHETLNQKVEPRQAWTYNPGQRRVRRAPNVAYDNPGTASDAQRTNDQLDQYNGAPDRYNWELQGRRELFIPYNSYRIHATQDNDTILQAGHVNPNLLRYELHRVWVTDATLKEGTSHIYARRTFYLDEDSWQIAVVDAYDKRGDIWRVSETHLINYYENPLVWETLLCHYDLQNGRYQAFGLNTGAGVDAFDVEFNLDQFTPEGLRRLGRR